MSDQPALPLFEIPNAHEAAKEFNYTGKLVCLDIEATGFDNDNDDIIEIAAVIFDGEKIYDRFETLLHTNKEIPIIVQDLTGINKEMLIGKPNLEDIKDQLIDFVKDYPIIGHNINFDLDYLAAKGIHLPGARIDTHPMSEIFFPEAISHSLEILCYLHTQTQPSHRAMDDVLANVELFQYMERLWLERKTEISETILNKSAVPWKNIFLNSKINLANHQDHKNTQNNTLEQANSRIQSIADLNSYELVVTNDHLCQELVKNNGFKLLPPHYNIISKTKLEQLLAKESLTEHEGMVGLKISLCPTFKSELITTDDFKVGRNEYKIIRHLTETTPHIPATLINADKLVISHSHFFQLFSIKHTNSDIARLLNKKILYLAEPFLEETYIRSQTETIHYNDFSEGTADIAFGLLGMFWNNSQNEEKSETLILTPNHISTPAWQQVISSFNGLNKELPSLETHYVWLKSQKQSPPYIQMLSRNCSYKLTTFEEELTNFNCHNYGERDPKVVYVDQQIPKPTDFTYNQAICKSLDKLITDNQKDICVITTSHDQIKTIYKHCLKFHAHRNCLAQGLSGSAGKISHNITEYEGHNVLICTYQFYLKHKPQFKELDALVLIKMPMSAPQHPYYDIQKQENKNFFNDYVIPHSAFNLLETLQIPDPCPSIYLLDSRIQTESYGREIQELLKEVVRFN